MSKPSKSIRRYIRKEKARMGREILSKVQREEAQKKLLEGFTPQKIRGKEKD